MLEMFKKHPHNQCFLVRGACFYHEKVRTLNYKGVRTGILCGFEFYRTAITYYESYMPCVLTDWNTSNGKVLSVASKTAGMQGDIGTFAKDMNEEFYKILSDKTKNGPLDGCMGLIMMDRVGEAEASKRIPQIIIANNFKFELNTDIEIPEGGEIKQGDEILSRKNTRSIELPEQPTIIWE